MNKKILLLVALVFAAGCAKKQMIKPSEEPQAAVEAEDTTEPSVRFKDWQPVVELSAVVFDYDSVGLSAEARAVLERNSEYLKSHREFVALVEGYCDERGTVEYNLALGQRRAQSVREYYGRLGVSLNAIGTISYGEEKPVDPASNESAWAKNRRAETKIRLSQSK